MLVQSMLDWVKSMGFTVETHILKTNHPDNILEIYIPSKKLAIEYCDVLKHGSYGNTEKNRHYNKMKCAKDEDIRVITIFQDEWENRNVQVKNFIKSVLGINSLRGFGRKCKVKEVEKNTANKFLNDHHIQGKVMHKVALGLYYQDELVGMVTGSNHHRQGFDDIFVLNRLVFKDEIQIVGGSGLLLKKLIDYSKAAGYKELISWSDNRISEGNVYQKTGFELIEHLNPDYQYVRPDGVVESKQSNKKKCLIRKGAVGIHEECTEMQLAHTLGYVRIFDCGKKRWSVKLA